MLSDKILAIDDDPRVFASLRLCLSKYEIVEFTSPDKAVDFLRKPNFIKLVLLDVYIKEKNGIETLYAIREVNEKVPVIIMTAFGSMDVAVAALRGRANDFIEKPFDVKTLREKVERILEEPLYISRRQRAGEEKVERIKRFIDQNTSEASLRNISQELRLSSKYISRLFSKESEVPFRDYKVNVKIEKAKELLREASVPIAEISAQLGYQNPESFMRIFKKRTGVTPTEYRTKKGS